MLQIQTLVLDYNGFSSLVAKLDKIVNALSSDLAIIKESAKAHI